MKATAHPGIQYQLVFGAALAGFVLGMQVANPMRSPVPAIRQTAPVYFRDERHPPPPAAEGHYCLQDGHEQHSDRLLDDHGNYLTSD